MITAKEAQELTIDLSRSWGNLSYKAIEEEIRLACEKRHLETVVTGWISDAQQKHLEELGYTLKRLRNVPKRHPNTHIGIIELPEYLIQWKKL